MTFVQFLFFLLIEVQFQQSMKFVLVAYWKFFVQLAREVHMKRCSAIFDQFSVCTRKGQPLQNIVECYVS